MKQLNRFEKASKANKRGYARARRQLIQTRIEMSRLVRSINFNPQEKKRLIEKLRHTVEHVHWLERNARGWSAASAALAVSCVRAARS